EGANAPAAAAWSGVPVERARGAGAGMKKGRLGHARPTLGARFSSTGSALEGAADLADDVVGGGVDGRELGDVEQRLGEGFALFRVRDVDERGGDLGLQVRVEAGLDVHAVVGDVGGVAEDADLLLDVRVVG